MGQNSAWTDVNSSIFCFKHISLTVELWCLVLFTLICYGCAYARHDVLKYIADSFSAHSRRVRPPRFFSNGDRLPKTRKHLHPLTKFAKRDPKSERSVCLMYQQQSILRVMRC
uniref:Uncharacterized protein n=1 Tax=Schistocephalus solidus TaxID=70667 RepID=A0A0V0J4H6_SCHSO